MTLHLTDQEVDLLTGALRQYNLASVIATTWEDCPNKRRLAQKVLPRLKRLQVKIERIKSGHTEVDS